MVVFCVSWVSLPVFMTPPQLQEHHQTKSQKNWGQHRQKIPGTKHERNSRPLVWGYISFEFIWCFQTSTNKSKTDLIPIKGHKWTYFNISTRKSLSHSPHLKNPKVRNFLTHNKKQALGVGPLARVVHKNPPVHLRRAKNYANHVSIIYSSWRVIHNCQVFFVFFPVKWCALSSHLQGPINFNGLGPATWAFLLPCSTLEEGNSLKCHPT